MSDFNLNLLDDAGAATKQSELASEKLSFGKWQFVGANYSQWQENEGAFAEMDKAQYDTARAAKEKGLKVAYLINIDIQELNPDLAFTYDRKLDVGGADWNKTFIPSLAEVFPADGVYGKGHKVDEANLNNALRKLHGAYVCVSDVPQQPRKNDKHINPTTGEPYRTTKLVAVYADKDSCIAAKDVRFAKRDVASSNGNGHVSTITLWGDVANDTSFAQELATAAAAVKAPPQKVNALKTIAENWGMTEADASAHVAEMKVLAGM